MRDAGLYGGVVRDLKDPSKKAISGKESDSIKPRFCALSDSYCVRLAWRSSVYVFIVCRRVACVGDGKGDFGDFGSALAGAP